MNPIQDIPGKLTRKHHPVGGWGDERNGACLFKLKSGATARVIFSDGEGWDHVSVSIASRCPLWDEMCEVRDLFWPPDVWVMQLHPPAAEYVNCHPNCLHLWLPLDAPIPTPPAIMVGPKP